jgi:hypothetical protein
VKRRRRLLSSLRPFLRSVRRLPPHGLRGEVDFVIEYAFTTTMY